MCFLSLPELSPRVAARDFAIEQLVESLAEDAGEPPSVWIPREQVAFYGLEFLVLGGCGDVGSRQLIGRVQGFLL